MKQVMKKELFKGKYTVFNQTIKKEDLISTDMDELLKYLKTHIDNHTVARYIADFDHMAHTHAIEQGTVDGSILKARIIMFCFGKVLDNPLTLAVRPRSIGVAERKDDFIFSFMDAPRPELNDVMSGWVQSLVKM